MLHKNLRLNFKNVDSFINFISKKFEKENFTEIDSDDDYILFRYEGNDIDYYSEEDFDSYEDWEYFSNDNTGTVSYLTRKIQDKIYKNYGIELEYNSLGYDYYDCYDEVEVYFTY